MSIDPAEFRAAMARFPGAVTIVTACAEGERRGITATAVCSVTAEPPSVLVCLNRKTGTFAAVAKTGRFNVNLLAGDGGEVAMRFAGQDGVTGEDKFAAGNWRKDGRGLPVLADSVVSLSCEVTETMEAGSHSVFIGRIDEIATGGGAALIYERSKFRCLEPA
ncbi:flavin reductase family protein [Oricola sp.]|uniref:flavin reductase family protein n=1 Tax=Oricola sp. TaxID=1979950 RepID=UPI003BA99837